MEYIVFASGSSGNATLIIGSKGKILIDFGLSKKKFLEKLGQYGLTPADIDALLITHSHSDHLLSEDIIEDLFTKEKIFAAKTTYNALDSNYLNPLEAIEIAGMKIAPIPLSHDIACLGFIIVDGQEKLTYITDTGYLHQRLLPLIDNSTHFLLESNYDSLMLHESGRHWSLIQRIISPQGHLSNAAAGEILKKVVGAKTKSICLMHLSGDCNTKELAVATVQESIVASNLNIKLFASDREETVALVDQMEVV